MDPKQLRERVSELGLPQLPDAALPPRAVAVSTTQPINSQEAQLAGMISRKRLKAVLPPAPAISTEARLRAALTLLARGPRVADAGGPLSISARQAVNDALDGMSPRDLDQMLGSLAREEREVLLEAMLLDRQRGA